MATELELSLCVWLSDGGRVHIQNSDDMSFLIEVHNIYEFKVIQFHAKAPLLKPLGDFRPVQASGRESVICQYVCLFFDIEK